MGEALLRFSCLPLGVIMICQAVTIEEASFGEVEHAGKFLRDNNAFLLHKNLFVVLRLHLTLSKVDKDRVNIEGPLETTDAISQAC